MARSTTRHDLGRGTSLGGLALVVTGCLAMAAGVVWLVSSSSDDEPAAAPTTAATQATTTTTTPPAETPEEFFERWVAALRGGDAELLFERLHPTMFDRYDEAACRAYLGGLRAPIAEAEVLEVGGTGTWSWETDGLARDIPDATTVRVRRTEDGDTFIENDTHVVVGDDGLVRWFTDCGTPKEGAR